MDVPQFLQKLAENAPGPAKIVPIATGTYTDLRLDLTRSGESEPSVWLLVSAGQEVLFLNVAGGYQTIQTAYTLVDQIEVLQDLFDIGCLFINGGFTEHLWERNGHVIFRELRVDGGTQAFLAGGGLRGRLRRRFGRKVTYRQVDGEPR